MPKPVESELEPCSEGFRVRLRYGKGLRGRFVIKLTDRAAALRRRLRLQELAELLAGAGHSAEAPIILRKAAAVQSDKDFAEAVRVAEELCQSPHAGARKVRVVTFRQLADDWTSGRLHARYPDHVKAKDSAIDECRLEKLCACDVGGLKLGDVQLAHFTLDHAERAMAQLPEEARRPATRRQYAQLLHRVAALAVYPCRIIHANPLPRGFLPKTGKPPAYPYLYPVEDEALAGCSAVPLARRVLFAFLAREGCRVSEATGLKVRDVDLEVGALSLDENKTDDARTWALDAGVTAALRAWVAQRGASAADPLFVDEFGRPLDGESLAPLLRADLGAAGVTRKELLVAGTNRQPIRVHDLRGTFITLSLANGRSETWVADRTGHTTSAMINRYRRAARSAGELGLGPLLPMDQVVSELCQRRPTRAQWEPLAELKAPEGGPQGGPDLVSRDGIEPPTRGFSILNQDAWTDGQAAKQLPVYTPASAIEHDGPPETAGVGQVLAQADPVEQALAEALQRAARAEAWATVEVLTAELRARRAARAGVVQLEAERAKRGRGQ